MKTGRGAARPTRGASEKILLRMTPELAQASEKAAKRAGLSLSEWIRRAMEAALPK